MTNDCCDQMADLLVDYADGELHGAEADSVRQHLASCPACRARLGQLERSLHLARAVWDESNDAAITPCPRPLVIWQPACAAALLIAAGICFLGYHARHDINSVARTTIVEPFDDLDIEKLVSHEAQAARLGAAADLLANHSATEPYDRDALKYLATAYPDTQAARRRAVSTEYLP